MKILIFGSAGFIGSHLARHAAAVGYKVVCFCRSGKVAGFEGLCLAWSLGGSLNEAAVQGADCALHLAHDFDGEAGAARTLDGTVAAVEMLHRAGVGRQLIFSSYSAGPQATSLYGRTKSAIEKRVADVPGVVILRPGLVLGDGGIYGRMQKFVRLSPVVPLPDGGRGLMPVITVERLCSSTLEIASSPAPLREYNLFTKEVLTLKQVVQNAAKVTNRSVWILPIPATAVLFGLRIAAMIRVPLPVKADNLEGFLANQGASHVSFLADE